MPEAANVWKDNVLQMIEETPAKDIFNVDKTGLFYKCTQDKLKLGRCQYGWDRKVAFTDDR